MGRKDADASDSEVSESTRAALRIQRELEEGDTNASSSRSGHRDRRPADKRSDPTSRRDGDDALGDGRKYGAITGIKLGEFASGASGSARTRGSSGVAVKGKEGRGRGNVGMSLESLANQADSGDEGGSTKMPEAPEGSYKRKDLTTAGGQAKSQRGIDGKVWDFLPEPEEPEVSERIDKAEKTAKAIKANKEKLKKKAKGKKDKKDKDKSKKKKTKKKKKSKGKNKKQDTASSSSSSSSSSS